MANLSESPQWVDGIYQIETSDPVVGGPNGVSNRQAKELASRTSYLKEEQEKTGSALAAHTAAADPHTQYAPKESPTFTGTPKAPTPATDSNSQQVATTAFVKSIAAALVNGAPAALDTLKELAAAVGNDPNFSATVLSELAKKLSLSGGTLTGELLSSAGNALRLISGDYGVIVRNDDRDFYLLLTEKGNKYGQWNNLRPFRINLATGDVFMASKVDISTLLENGQRVYSPNNKPTAADVGAYTKTETDNAVSVATTAANNAATAAANANTNANGRVPSGRTVNGKVLSADITLNSGDVGAYTKAETNNALSAKLDATRLQSGPFDATAGSLLINGAWGLGGVGETVSLDDTAFLSWVRSTNTGSRVFRNNNAANTHTKQFGTGTLMRAGDTWSTITFGIGAGTVAGVRAAAGNNSGQNTTVYEFWTDKNLPSPATTDTAQTIIGMKTFWETPRVTRANFPGMVMTCTNVNEGVIGREISMLSDMGESIAFYIRSGDGTMDNQRIVRIPMSASGTALVSGANVVADSSGYYKTPGSAEVIPLSTKEIVGVPLPYPGATAPSGWLKCNGQAFNKSLYPVLASRYPSGTLPDLRGEFVRGFDDGRGIDVGRGILSAQGDAIRNITGQLETLEHSTYSPTGVFSINQRSSASISGQYVGQQHTYVDFDASLVVPTANENRPRNIAFNYIVRAA